MVRTLIAGIELKENSGDFHSLLSECRELCLACSLEPVGMITQQSATMDPRTAFRSGKLNELAERVKSEKIELVVFVNELTVSVAQRIADICECQVIDRTSLILDIFQKRARSRQARIQVEAARLEYALPRLASGNESETHIRGGSYRSRGAGEMRSEQIARKYRARIKELHQELADIQKRTDNAETRRSKSSLARCALVGYTNAGKSSLMNALLRRSQRSKDQVYEKDMLFATLDTSVRRLQHHGRQFLLYDTVGFVSDLPRQLLDAFHSTLDSARHADLLIQVIDVSDPAWQKKAAVTIDTLEQIGAGKVPVLRVYNKIDLISHPERFDGICTSTVTGEGLKELLDALVDALYPLEEKMVCMVPYEKMAVIDQGRSSLRIDTMEETEDGLRVLVQGPHDRIQLFKKYKENV